MVTPQLRSRCFFLLAEHVDHARCRELEAIVMSHSTSEDMYVNKIRQLAHNLKKNPALASETASLAFETNATMSRGTDVEEANLALRARQVVFENLLKEKIDKVSSTEVRSAITCRRCKSTDVVTEQRQTRSADEAMTIFCMCSKCNTRWTM